jgi:hypothetical protein
MSRISVYSLYTLRFTFTFTVDPTPSRPNPKLPVLPKTRVGTPGGCQISYKECTGCHQLNVF